MRIDEIINGQRKVCTDYHLMVAFSWKEYGRNKLLPSPLVYSAFEYRCAIERVIMELYIIMQHEMTDIEDLGKYEKISDLIKKVHELGGGSKGLLYRVLKFNSIVSEFVMIQGKTLSRPDLGKLHKLWQKLSKYCHRQAKPIDSWDSKDWVTKGYKLLDEVHSYLHVILIEHLFGAMPEIGMPLEVIEAKRDFVQEKINEEGLRRRLILMEPVLEARRKKKER